jgi:hypothetical protein
MVDLRTNEYALLDFVSLEAEMLGRMLSALMYGYIEFRHKKYDGRHESPMTWNRYEAILTREGGYCERLCAIFKSSFIL